MPGGAPEKRLTVVYWRAEAIAVAAWNREVGGGMDFKHKRFLALTERIQRGKTAEGLGAHKDRLVRFGFDLLDHLSRQNGCEVIVVNQESLSPEQELVEDLPSIVHTFSYRLDGLRKYKKQIKDDYSDSREPKALLE